MNFSNSKSLIKGFFIPFLFIVSIVLLLAGCGNSEKKPVEEVKKMNVVATTTMLSDLSRQIGGDKVEVHGLMQPGVDPHLYQASAGDVSAMNEADVVVYNGVHLEGQMDSIFENLEKQKKTLVRVSDGINPTTLLDFEEDGEKTKDPHIWFSVENWKQAAKQVALGFSKKDPDNQKYYNENLQKYLEELDKLDQRIKDKINEVPQESRVLVTAHDAFSYFARDYKFEVKGIQGVTTEAEAATSDISELADFIVAHKIKAIFVESSVPTKTIEALQAAVKAKGFEVAIGGELFSDSLGDEGTKEGTYIGMYEKNIETITGALK